MDFISKMPDSIRNYIVSFLSMEDAIRTSALSKQWRNVCSSLPRFEFSHGYFARKTNKRYDFEDFVDQTIRCHDGSSIESFSLTVKAEDLYGDARIMSWITFAIKHKVKDLTIEIRKFDSLSDCLFTCDSLTNLRMWGVTLNTPAELKFLMLKSITLSTVQFNSNNQTNQLVINCPLLESLNFTWCSWKNTDDLIIHALNLTTLIMYPCCAHNVTVHCPRLSKSIYYGNPPDISSESLSSLLDASFIYPSSSDPITTLAQNVVDQHVRKIVMGLSNVVCLSLDQFWLEILSRSGDIFSNQAIPFCSLKKLHVTMFTKENEAHFLAFLLRICSNLQTLHVSVEEQDQHSDMSNMEGYFQQKNFSIKDYLKHLKVVTIGSFEGSDYGFYLVRHLLENANILKEMKIRCSIKLDEDEPRIASITEKVTQIVAVSPYVTTSVCSLNDWLRRVAEDRKS